VIVLVARRVFVATLVNTVFLVHAGYLGGRLSDKAQRRKIFVLIASRIYAAGPAVGALVTSFNRYLVALAICGAGQGAYFAMDLAAAVLPEGGEETVQDLGVLNSANALPQSIAPAIAPALSRHRQRRQLYGAFHRGGSVRAGRGPGDSAC
jgi:MFS family permease